MLLFLPGMVGMVLAAQTAPATVTGVVRSGRTGEPLAGAVVSLTDLHRVTITDGGGRYRMPQVPAGPQHLAIRFIGYEPRTVHALVPSSGRLEINIALQPLPVRLATVDVRPRLSIRGVDVVDTAALLDRGLSIAAVRNHPLLAEPDVLQALGGGHVVLRPEAPAGVHVRGGGSDQTAYLLDGIPVFNPYHAVGVFSAWDADAIDRVRLSVVAATPAHPDALSGVVEAVTRVPGAQVGAQGSVSTTHASVTLDGPLGSGAGGWLISVRSGFPGAAASSEASYVRGEGGDWLAKLELEALGGEVRVLGYENANEVTTAAHSSAEEGPRDPARNAFEWGGRSWGAEWRRVFSGLSARILAWRAETEAGSVWAHGFSRVTLAAARRDAGVLASAELGAARGTTVAGLRLQRSRASYLVDTDPPAERQWDIGARTPTASLFIRHARSVIQDVELEAGGSVTAGGHGILPGPLVRVEWRASDRLAFAGSYARLHQFSQSLRNAESVVGTVFPVDLYVGSGAEDVPVASSDQGVITAAYRPFAGARLEVQGYARSFDGLLLAAPRTGDPFAVEAFAVGSGFSRGISVDAAASSARVGITASYGWQRVRLHDEGSSYVPDHGATHHADGGVTVFPGPTWSIRLGAVAAVGRRTTTASGGFEWEACNLLDAGCEFTGSPRYDGEPLGAAPLPSYLRVDLGLRKHWHVAMRGREVVVGLYGTISNVFDRENVLTYARDPQTGAPGAVTMRPLVPLVVGVDWRF